MKGVFIVILLLLPLVTLSYMNKRFLLKNINILKLKMSSITAIESSSLEITSIFSNLNLNINPNPTRYNYNNNQNKINNI